MRLSETDVRRTIEDYLSSGKKVVLDHRPLFDEAMRVSAVARQIEEGIDQEIERSRTDFSYFISKLKGNNPDLASLVITEGDDRGLLHVTENAVCLGEQDGRQQGQCFRIGNRAFFMERGTPLQLVEVLSMACRTEATVRVRPDCFRRGVPLESVPWYSERVKGYGSPFDYRRLHFLSGSEEAERWSDNWSDAPSKTQFLWDRRKDGTVQGAIEELSLDETGKGTASLTRMPTTRFAHAMFAPQEGRFCHLDGAMHMYRNVDYQNRWNAKLRDYDKRYTKVKVFRIDGVMDEVVFQHVTEAFFRGNRQISEYFNGE